MAEPATDRVQRYILDGGDSDLRRLMSVSEVFADNARRSLIGAGVSAGWRVLDCGCGPMGALAVMADLVGPTGQAVGVDFSEPTIARARTVIGALGLECIRPIRWRCSTTSPAYCVQAAASSLTRRCALRRRAHSRILRRWPSTGSSSTMAAARERAKSASMISRVDDIVTRIRNANPQDYSWVTSTFFLGLTLRKPV